MSNQLIVSPIAPSLPVPAVFQGPAQAERRFWEFFTTQISNDNTRKAYFNAVRTFSAWCQSRNVAGANPKDAVARREFEGAAERDHQLSRCVRMPSKLRVCVCLLY